MSRLSSKLERRRKGTKERPVDTFSPDVQPPDDTVEKEDAPNIEATHQGAEDTPSAESKIDIIAQLKRRMQKIEQRDFPKKRQKHEEATSAQATVDHGNQYDAKPLDDHRIEDVRVEPVYDALPGRVLDTESGEVWLNEQRFENYFHGNASAQRYLKTGTSLATFAKDERLLKLSPEGALFIDTETTGLSGGAGTLPFLIGVGFFENKTFVVEQYFCREPSEESAQLEALVKRLEKATYLVSFNGKSFDMPLINTRFVINRIANPAYNLPHLDLLHVARRIFKRRLNDRSLQNLERVILEFQRYGDIPGAEIPAAYREYLSGLGTEKVVSILEHNVLDIVALAALGGVLDELYHNPKKVAHAADSLGLAKEAMGAGEFQMGSAHLNTAGEFGYGEDKRIALHLKAKTLMRNEDFEEAVSVYSQIIDEFSDDEFAHIALAKYYEHKTKEFDKALFHAQKVESLEGDMGREKRILRIEKKKEKQRE